MRSATGLRVLSLFLGIFFVFMGLDKFAWLSDAGLLTKQLNDWLASSPPASQWYLRTIAIPGAPVFARLVVAGELGTGAALLVGFKPRIAALVGLVMVLNFHSRWAFFCGTAIGTATARPCSADCWRSLSVARACRSVCQPGLGRPGLKNEAAEEVWDRVAFPRCPRIPRGRNHSTD